MKIMTKIVILTLALVIMVMPAVACAQPTPPSPPPPPAPKKITLADAPVVLDLSPVLPATFEQVDAASEGLSNADMGLGSDCSEVELFVSDEPFQMIYCFLYIDESRIARAGFDATIKDERQMESMVVENLKAGALAEGFELQVPQIEITYPDIADSALLGEGFMTSFGMSIGFDTLWFRSNTVYVYLYSLYLSLEKQSLAPIAREIEHQISMFSQ